MVSASTNPVLRRLDLAKLGELEALYAEMRPLLDQSPYPADPAIVQEYRLWDAMKEIKDELCLCLQIYCRSTASHGSSFCGERE